MDPSKIQRLHTNFDNNRNIAVNVEDHLLFNIYEHDHNHDYALEHDYDNDQLIYQVVGLPPGASFDFDSKGGSFSWTPDISQLGKKYIVIFTVSDSDAKNVIDAKAVCFTVIPSVSRSPVLFNSFHSFLVNYPLGGEPNSILTSDLNNDGKLDIVGINYDTDSISILLNLGNNVFSKNIDYRVSGHPIAGICEDLDSDGDMDLAIANSSTNNVSVLLTMGNATFDQKQNFGLGDSPKFLTSGDINKDGKIDLVTANSATDDVTVLLNLGNGIFGERSNYSVGVNPGPIILEDFNKDGYPDLAVENMWDISVLLNNGNGNFNEKTNYNIRLEAVSGYPAERAIGQDLLCTGDFDGDGNLDLAIPYAFNSNSRLMSFLRDINFYLHNYR